MAPNMAAGGSRPRGTMLQEEWKQTERRSEESGPREGDVKQRVAANVENVGPRRRKGKARGIFPAPTERTRAPQPGEREEHQEKNQAEQRGAEDPEREGDVWNGGGKLARIRNAEVVKEKCQQRRGNCGTE